MVQSDLSLLCPHMRFGPFSHVEFNIDSTRHAKREFRLDDAIDEPTKSNEKAIIFSFSV